MKIDAAYLEILKNRMRYFDSKTITELTDDEVQEFISLKKEIQNVLEDLSNVIKATFEPISEAAMKYKTRVLKQ